MAEEGVIPEGLIDLEREGDLLLVVSLKQDADRRKKLVQGFSGFRGQFVWVDAVDCRNGLPGGMAKITTWPKASGITTAEIGCTLSHLKAMRYFVESGRRRCLVFEDDVSGECDSIKDVLDLLSMLPSDAILICGGQQGLKNRRYLYGEEVRAGVWRIPQMSRRFLARTCCYALTQPMAMMLIQRQGKRLVRADNWSLLLRGHRNVYFVDAFQHPIDLSGSHIESQRKKLLAGSGWMKVVWRDGPCYTLTTFLIKIMLPFLPLLTRYRPVRSSTVLQAKV